MCLELMAKPGASASQGMSKQGDGTLGTRSGFRGELAGQLMGYKEPGAGRWVVLIWAGRDQVPVDASQS